MEAYAYAYALLGLVVLFAIYWFGRRSGEMGDYSYETDENGDEVVVDNRGDKDE